MSKDFLDNINLTSQFADKINRPYDDLIESIKSNVDSYRLNIDSFYHQDAIMDNLKYFASSVQGLFKAYDLTYDSAVANMQSLVQSVSDAVSVSSALHVQNTLNVLRNVDLSKLKRIEEASDFICSIPDDITVDTVSELIKNGEITDEDFQAELKSTITGTENEAVKGKSSIIQKALKFVAVQIILFLLATVFSPVTDKVKEEIVESFRIDEFWQNTGIVDWIDSWSNDNRTATEDEAKATVDESKTGNISKQKREDLLSKVKEIRNFISNAPQDENTGNLLSYLSEIEKDINGKKYGLVFEEHREDIDEVLETHTPVLTEEPDLFIDNGGQMNFLIEGDNLASLKLLEKTHQGKIDLIYIDPPYNTGGTDFRYDDTVIGKDDSFRHSKWLSFMTKRLKIAKNLLSENGIIFISIDENEQASLKMLCDELFSQDNHIETVIWKNKYGAGAKTVGFITVHEYVLCYSKPPTKDLTSDLDKDGQAEYKKKDEKYEKRGGYLTQPLMTKSLGDRPNLVYNIEYNGDTIVPRKQWVWSRERLLTAISNNEVEFNKKKDGSYSVRAKKYLIDENGNMRRGKPLSILNGPFTQDGTKEIRKYLGSEDAFKFAKPSELIRYFISFGINDKINKSAIILDFFAGSGTTAHAVIEQNKRDHGNRQFILCTNNENNICRDVTYERISRVIDNEKYAASLKYYKVDYLPISERMYYEYADELLKHIRELVELENGINFIGNAEIAIVLTDDELDNFTQNIERYSACRKLYMGHDLLPDEDQERIIEENNIEINIIPDYYYRDLQEA